jgi:hypothetical protein
MKPFLITLFVVLLALAGAYILGLGEYLGLKPSTPLEVQPVDVEVVTPTVAPPTDVVPEVEKSEVKVVEQAPVVKIPFEQRAKQRYITFTDSMGRSMVAEVLEVQSDSLKIRRHVDGMVMPLPTNMLSDEDQAFAAYLLQESTEQTRAGLSLEEMIEQSFQ